MKFYNMLVNEDLSSDKKDFKLKTSDINDEHIKKSLAFYAKSKNIPIHDAEFKFNELFNKITEYQLKH